MFFVNENDILGKAVVDLIGKAVPIAQSLKEEDFYLYVEDLQNEIITYFNYHKLSEVPLFIDKMITITLHGAKTDDKKKRYAAAVCIGTLINLFPFDDYIPLFEPVVFQLLRPGFKRLVVVGAYVVGLVGSISGPNRDHLIRILVEKHASNLSIVNNKPDSVFASAAILKELTVSAPEHIFDLGPAFFSKTISLGLQFRDSNVHDICISIVDSLINSQSASVGSSFLTEFLDSMRISAANKINNSSSQYELIANYRILQILLKQRPYIDSEMASRLLFPSCAEHVLSLNFDIMKNSIEIILYLNQSEIIFTDNNLIKTIIKQLFDLTPKNHKETEPVLVSVIHQYPHFIQKELIQILNGFSTLMMVLPRNIGPLLVFRLIVSTIEVVKEKKQLSSLLEMVNQIMSISSVPTPIHLLLHALNKRHKDWDRIFHIYKQYLVRLIHEELGVPFQRWEAVVISFNAIDQLNNLSYPDAVMLHTLVMSFQSSEDWQVRERVAFSAIHLFQGQYDRMPLETVSNLVNLAVNDAVRSVRKKSLFSFTPQIYKYLAQPEIIGVFSQLMYDESFTIRKQAIGVLGELVPLTSASILRELLLTTLRQLPDKYNPIIPSRISDIFPQLIWASQPIIHLYADAIFQRFLKMLNERFNSQPYKDPALVYMNSAQLRDIDGSLIKSLSRLNELCPHIVSSKPVISILSTILSEPVHPWTKTHALKALKNIAQGEKDIIYIWKEHFSLIESLLKIIRENTSIKLVTKSLKVLGSLSACALPPMPSVSSRKNFFIFRSFFSGAQEFRRYFVRLLFIDLLGILNEPMIDPKRETIVGVLTQLFVYESDSVPQYLSSFFHVFLPLFASTGVKTLRVFFEDLRTVIIQSGRLISPYATMIYQAIESFWRQQLTLEGSRVLCALIKATHGQCDSILHLAVPICFQLIKFRTQSSAYELFKLLRTAAYHTPSYLTTIIEGISDLSITTEKSDSLIGLCIKTLGFIVDSCDCVEHLPTIKRCVLKLKSNTGVKHREAAIDLVEAIEERKHDDTDLDDDNETKTLPPSISNNDVTDISHYLQLPPELDDDSLAKWYKGLETQILAVSPSPIVRSLQPLNDFPGLLPKFSFTFAFLTLWQTLSRNQKSEITILLNAVFKCSAIPTWIARQFVNLAEFSILCEIDIRLDFSALIPFCEDRSFNAKALFFLESAPSTFPFTKLIYLNSVVGRKLEARSLAIQYETIMDHKLWIQLGEWENALACIRKTLDPTRFVFPQVICKAALEDWDGILSHKEAFFELPINEKVQLARYFMTAEVFSGDFTSAKEFFDMSNGFSVEDQIMRAQMLISNRNIAAASQSIHIGWRYLSATVASVEKWNKNMIQDYAFQAQELLELSEVITCLKNPQKVEEMNKVWRGRLRLIQNQPDRQKELFKIRSLVPNLPHFDAHMLNCISYFIWLGQKDVAKRLGDVFFPNESSPHAQYVALEMVGREEKIEEMLNLAKTSENRELQSRLLQLVGNIKLKRACTVEGLKVVAEHYIEAAKSYEKIGNIYLLLAHAANDFEAASNGVNAIGKAILTKPVKGSLFANQLLGALTNFGRNESVSSQVSEAVKNLSPQNLASVFYTSFSLLLHSSHNIQEVSFQLCNRLVSEFPQYISFQLLMMEKIHSNVSVLSHLYDKLQMEHPVTFSNVSMIFNELQNIAGSLFQRLKKSVTESFISFEKGEIEEAKSILSKFFRQLADPNKSIHDKQFFSANESTLLEIWNSILKDGKLSQADYDRLNHQISVLTKRFQSIRVIRLSSISERLEKQQKWDLYLLGSQSLLPNGVKISKFFHSLGNHEHGFQITILGVDGKRYNFLLRRVSRSNPLATEQLVEMISSLIEDILHVKRGSIIQLTPKLHLFEVPKGQVSMSELVTVYMQSKQRIIDAEQIAIREWTKSDYSSLNHDDKVRVLLNLRKLFECSELSRALLVTSKDADAWAYRTSHFASSLGAMSVVAFFIGTVDSSPSQILIDKISGSVTFNSFAGVDPTQPIPFRLTPMILNTLGRYQTKGPFMNSFTQSMKEIRKRATAIAPFLQFTCSKPPFETPMIPTVFLKGLGVSIDQNAPVSEIDELYTRICGTNSFPLETEINLLIESAKDVDNQAKMPVLWYPWW